MNECTKLHNFLQVAEGVQQRTAEMLMANAGENIHTELNTSGR